MTIDKRQEFWNLLNSLKMDTDSTDYADFEKNMNIIHNWVIDNIPEKIYRFFSNKKRNVIALKNNEVWGSLPSNFNDPYECFPSYNHNLIVNEIEIETNVENMYNLFKNLQNGNNRNIERYVVLDDKSIFQNTLDDLKNIIKNDNDLRIFSDDISNYCRNDIIHNWNQFQNRFRIDFLYNYYITCFSETRDDTLMWGHYANSHKGFCVEYDFKELIKEEFSKNINKIKLFLFPVIYSKERFDGTSYFYTLIQQYLCRNSNFRFYPYYQDLLFGLKVLITKSKNWEYEKEWRLFSLRETLDIPNFKKQLEISPKAVYIGANMLKYWSNWINKICKEKNIPSYKMMLSYDNTYTLTPIPYVDYIRNWEKKKNF